MQAIAWLRGLLALLSTLAVNMFPLPAIAVPISIAQDPEPVLRADVFQGDEFSYVWGFSVALGEATIAIEPDFTKHPGGAAAGRNLVGTWAPTAIFTESDSTVLLAVTSVHTRDPHTDVLGVDGDFFSFEREIQSLADTAALKRLIIDVKDHADSVGMHKDIYRILYKRSGDGFEFRISGEHRAVPEPSGLFLFGAGLAGMIVIIRWRCVRLGRVAVRVRPISTQPARMGSV